MARMASERSGRDVKPRCQDLRCRLAITMSDLPFDANREPNQALDCLPVGPSKSVHGVPPLAGWVEDLFKAAHLSVDTSRLVRACEVHAERSDPFSFVEEVSSVA